MIWINGPPLELWKPRKYVLSLLKSGYRGALHKATDPPTQSRKSSAFPAVFFSRTRPNDYLLCDFLAYNVSHVLVYWCIVGLTKLQFCIVAWWSLRWLLIQQHISKLFVWFVEAMCFVGRDFCVHHLSLKVLILFIAHFPLVRGVAAYSHQTFPWTIVV